MVYALQRQSDNRGNLLARLPIQIWIIGTHFLMDIGMF